MRARPKSTPVAEPPEGILIGYARVSTEDQSLDTQVEALTRAGVAEANIHVDKMSGASSKRPGLADALLDARAGDTLVVWKLDRLGRTLLPLMILLDKLRGRGIKFRSLTEALDTETIAGRMMFQILGAVAEMERALTVERTKATLASKREKGWKGGAPPKLTEEQAAEALVLLRGGASPGELAEKYKVSRQVIYTRVSWPERDRIAARAAARHARKSSS